MEIFLGAILIVLLYIAYKIASCVTVFHKLLHRIDRLHEMLGNWSARWEMVHGDELDKESKKVEDWLKNK